MKIRHGIGPTGGGNEDQNQKPSAEKPKSNPKQPIAEAFRRWKQRMTLLMNRNKTMSATVLPASPKCNSTVRSVTNNNTRDDDDALSVASTACDSDANVTPGNSISPSEISETDSEAETRAQPER